MSESDNKQQSVTCVSLCDCYVLGEELHGDPDTGVHDALDQPGVDIQVCNETDEPDNHERRSQHDLLPELLQKEKAAGQIMKKARGQRYEMERKRLVGNVKERWNKELAGQIEKKK